VVADELVVVLAETDIVEERDTEVVEDRLRDADDVDDAPVDDETLSVGVEDIEKDRDEEGDKVAEFDPV
jgi:hypothetical protein